jgi:hypothetical protein
MLEINVDEADAGQLKGADRRPVGLLPCADPRAV